MDPLNVTHLCFAASYGLAFLLELWQLRRPSRAARRLQQAVTLAGLVAQALFLSQNTLSFAAGSTTLLYVAFVMAIFYFSGSLHYERFTWGLFVLPVVLGLVLLAWLRRETGGIELPAAQVERGWMVLHIAFIVLGFVGLSIAFLSSLMYLVQSSFLKRKAWHSHLRLLSLERLETMNRRAVLIAFPLLTSGLALGFLLMSRAPQLSWQDPKVLATIPVWLAVGLLLVLRYGLHSPARRLAWVSILSFLLMLLAVAVPWLWPSAHPTGGLAP